MSNSEGKLMIWSAKVLYFDFKYITINYKLGLGLSNIKIINLVMVLVVYKLIPRGWLKC